MPTEAGLVPTITPVRLRRIQNNPVMRQDPTGMLDGGVLEDGNPGGPTHTKRLPAPDLNNPDPKLDRSPFPDLVVPIRETLLDDVDVQPIGESTWLKDVFYHTFAFGCGLANAIGSNGLFGLGRKDPNSFGDLSNSARSGQITGDFLSLLVGTGEMILGGAVTLGGGGLSISGFGVVVAVPAIALGSGMALHGASTISTAFNNLLGDLKSRSRDQMSDGGNSSSKSGSGGKKSINQLNQEVRKGKAPKDIDHFDPGVDINQPQDHVHFKDGRALNRDGTWRHNKQESNYIPRKTRKYLEENGWITP